MPGLAGSWSGRFTASFHASEYQLYLPTSEQLVKEINEVKQLAREKSVNEKL